MLEGDPDVGAGGVGGMRGVGRPRPRLYAAELFGHPPLPRLALGRGGQSGVRGGGLAGGGGELAGPGAGGGGGGDVAVAGALRDSVRLQVADPVRHRQRVVSLQQEFRAGGGRGEAEDMLPLGVVARHLHTVVTDVNPLA